MKKMLLQKKNNNDKVPLGTETYAVFIKRVMDEDLDWTLYLNPFSFDVWEFLLLYSLACTAAIEFFEVVTSERNKEKRVKTLKGFRYK